MEAIKMVPTRASLLRNQNQVDVVVFTKKSKTSSSQRKHEVKIPSKNPEEFNVKQATKEIIKMGTKGFHKFRRDKTLKGLAVELGAKPEKKRYHNYKDLKEIRKVQKERRDKRLDMLQESSNLSSLNHFKKKYAKKKQKKVDFDILNSYGKAK